jgi:hypothetical protein
MKHLKIEVEKFGKLRPVQAGDFASGDCAAWWLWMDVGSPVSGIALAVVRKLNEVH